MVEGGDSSIVNGGGDSDKVSSIEDDVKGKVMKVEPNGREVRELMSSTKWKIDVNSLGSKDGLNKYSSRLDSEEVERGRERGREGGEIPMVKSFTGIKDVDEVLSMKTLNLGRSNQLVWMFGCRRCFLRGTSECPYGIKDGEEHSEGYCDSMVKLRLIEYRMMSTPNGMRHVRNVNLLQVQGVLQHYIAKLNDLRKSDRITPEELMMLGSLRKLYKDYGERIDKAIQQDEGTKIHMEKRLTPSDLNEMLRGARERRYGKAKEVEVDAEVEDGDSGTG